jgi:hypothetical protein
VKTSRLIILITTVAVLACGAPTASARPAADPANARPHVERATTAASIAAHHEQISEQQYVASHGQSEPVALTNATDTDSQFPLVFVLVGLSISLGIAIASILARPVRSYVRRRRPPASVA